MQEDSERYFDFKQKLLKHKFNYFLQFNLLFQSKNFLCLFVYSFPTPCLFSLPHYLSPFHSVREWLCLFVSSMSITFLTFVFYTASLFLCLFYIFACLSSLLPICKMIFGNSAQPKLLFKWSLTKPPWYSYCILSSILPYTFSHCTMVFSGIRIN